MKIVAKDPTAVTVVMMVLAALIVRAVAEIALSSVFPQQSYVIDRGCQILFYLLIIALSWVVAREAQISTDLIMGRAPTAASAFKAVGWAFILLAFSLGSGALVTYAIAHINLDLAYADGHYHPTPVDTLGNNAVGIALFAIPQFLLAPFGEELVFRGLLLRLLAKKHGFAVAVSASALLFTLFHFSQSDYVGTFMFAIVVAVLYLRTKSLWIPVITHSTYNLIAYLQQGLFDFHWTRTKAQLLSLDAWGPEFALLLVSATAIGGYFWVCRKTEVNGI